jgi:hypothetical protein
MFSALEPSTTFRTTALTKTPFSPESQKSVVHSFISRRPILEKTDLPFPEGRNCLINEKQVDYLTQRNFFNDLGIRRASRTLLGISKEQEELIQDKKTNLRVLVHKEGGKNAFLSTGS